MSEPTSSPDPTPPVPPAPSFTYGSPAAPAQQPAAAPPASSEPLPPPAYGERIPGYEYPQAPAAPQAPTPGAAPGYAVPGYAAPAYGAPSGAPGYGQQPVRRRRTWDVVLTIILLVVGLFGALIGGFYGFIFMNPSLLAVGLQQQGLDPSVGDTSGIGAILLISHIVLYLVAAGVSIVLLVKNKIAFYVPLSAGVLAAIIFFGCVIAAAAHIPGLMSGYPGGF